MTGLRLLALLALVLSASARGEARGALRVWLGGGYDTNARRDFVKQDGSAGVSAEADAVLSGLASADGEWEGSAVRLGGSYDVGGRKFLTLVGEDVLQQSLSAGAAVAPVRGLVLGLEARGKDRRFGSQPYTDLLGELYAQWLPTPALELRLAGAAHRFLYWAQPEHTFGAPEVSLSARARLDRRHSLLAFGSFAARRYLDDSNPHPADPDPPPPSRRRDRVLGAGAGYAYKGPFTLSLTYSFLEQSSNSFGETVLRHRLALHGGVRLFWKLMLLAQLQAQLSRYPDGVFLGGEANISEDDDTHNSAVLKLVRPLGEHVDLELRYGLYHDQLPQNQFLYLRQVVMAGVGFRL